MIRIWKAEPVTDVNDIHIFEVILDTDTLGEDSPTIAYWINKQLSWNIPVHIVSCPDSMFLWTNETTNRMEEKPFSLDSGLAVRLGDSIQLYIVEQV